MTKDIQYIYGLFYPFSNNIEIYYHSVKVCSMATGVGRKVIMRLASRKQEMNGLKMEFICV